MRVGLIFDEKVRPDTTGVYCRRALETLADLTYLPPEVLAETDPKRFDLFLCIDDGLDYPLPEALRPLAFWAIDTHVNFDRRLERARNSDYVFTAQKNAISTLRQRGISKCHWLPLAADPDVHTRRNMPTRFDVAFVGNVVTPVRQRLLRRLALEFDRTFLGRCHFEKMADIYSASKVAFNKSVANDINMRVFEATACGAFLITDAIEDNGLEDLFEVDVDLVTYDVDDELLDKVRFYLRNDRVRSRIARSGNKATAARHTYKKRMEELLRVVQEHASYPRRRSPAATPFRFLQKDRTFYEFSRPDVRELIPTEANRILDIGCWSGRLGADLKAERIVQVIGVEINAEAAAVAKERLDEVFVGDVEQEHFGFDREFDCIVCADVLEHLKNPATVLSKAKSWLRDDGYIVASIPNAQHISLIEALLEGNWTYTSVGLLDESHLQFFTYREIETLFSNCGYRIRELRPVLSEEDLQWQSRRRPEGIEVGPIRVSLTNDIDAERFFASQYLLVAEPKENPQGRNRRPENSQNSEATTEDTVGTGSIA